MSEQGLPSSKTSAEDVLRGFLAGRDVDCPLCGYNLRDLQFSDSPRCPECGQPLELAVRVAPKAYAAWFIMVLFASFGAPIGAIILITIIAATRYGQWAVPDPMLGSSIAGFIVLIPILVAALIFRKRFMRWSHFKQWTISLAVAFLAAGAFILMGLYWLRN